MIAHGSKAVLPFDWDELASNDPAVQAFFIDALNYEVGHNGLSIPVRNRRGAYSVVSFTSNHPKHEWQDYKKNNMIKLQLMSVLIDSAASINLKLNSAPVKLSKREEQCLIWAARGKTYQDISEIPQHLIWQRQKLSGHGAAQTKLYQSDPRGRRRRRDRRDPGEGLEMISDLSTQHPGGIAPQ